MALNCRVDDAYRAVHDDGDDDGEDDDPLPIIMIKLIYKGAYAPKGPLKLEFYIHILDCRSRKTSTTIK